VISLIDQGAAERRRDLGVVIDHEDVRLLGHRSNLSTPE